MSAAKRRNAAARTQNAGGRRAVSRWRRILRLSTAVLAVLALAAAILVQWPIDPLYFSVL